MIIKIENEQETWYFTGPSKAAKYIGCSIQAVMACAKGLFHKCKGYAITEIDPEDNDIINTFIKG